MIFSGGNFQTQSLGHFVSILYWTTFVKVAINHPAIAVYSSQVILAFAKDWHQKKSYRLVTMDQPEGFLSSESSGDWWRMTHTTLILEIHWSCTTDFIQHQNCSYLCLQHYISFYWNWYCLEQHHQPNDLCNPHKPTEKVTCLATSFGSTTSPPQKKLLTSSIWNRLSKVRLDEILKQQNVKVSCRNC